MKKITAICFLIPFIFSALSIQAIVTKLISTSIGQFIAYFNVLLVIVGIFLYIKNKGGLKLPSTIKLWLRFFLLYFTIGLLGNIIHNTEVPLLKTTIPVIYFIGFSFYLSVEEYKNLFSKIVIIVFTIANILLIYFQKINFSMDVADGVSKFVLERAGGVYGDANNAAVVCLLSFVFITNYFNAKSKLQKTIKYICIVISIYGLVLTFSKTGFLVLLIVLVLTFHHLFNPKRILLLIIAFPLSLFLLVNISLNTDALSDIQKNRIENVVDIITFNTEKVSFSGRDVLFKNMMKYVYENPIIGNGIYFSTEIRGHNTIFGIWADAGIFCFILFLYLLFQFYRKAFLAPTRIRYFSLSILIILTIFMLTLQTIINQPYLVVLFAFLAFEMERKIDFKTME